MTSLLKPSSNGLSHSSHNSNAAAFADTSVIALTVLRSNNKSGSFRRLLPLLLVIVAGLMTTVVWGIMTQQRMLSSNYYSTVTHTFSLPSSDHPDSIWNQKSPTDVMVHGQQQLLLQNHDPQRMNDVWDSSSETIEPVINATSSSNFPLPYFTHETMVVLVMSARKHFDHRNTIRNTWAKGHDNVYFLIAAPCPYPGHLRSDDIMDCKSRQTNFDNQMMYTQNNYDNGNSLYQVMDLKYNEKLKSQENILRAEQAKHHDIIYLDNVYESYRSLPQKLKEGYHWVLRHFQPSRVVGTDGRFGGNRTNRTITTTVPSTTIRWLVKVDDDTVVRVSSLQHMLSRYNSQVPMVIGRIIDKSQVWRTGKWAEHPKYKADAYPFWPQGSCGHVVSYPVAQYLAHNKHNLFNYQGEDTSLGIWLDESDYMRNGIHWIDTPYFINEGDCTNPDWIIMGHEISTIKMNYCYQQYGDEVHRTQVWHEERAEFNPQVTFVNPGSLANTTTTATTTDHNRRNDR